MVFVSSWNKEKFLLEDFVRLWSNRAAPDQLTIPLDKLPWMHVRNVAYMKKWMNDLLNVSRNKIFFLTNVFSSLISINLCNERQIFLRFICFKTQVCETSLVSNFCIKDWRLKKQTTFAFGHFTTVSGYFLPTT